MNATLTLSRPEIPFFSVYGDLKPSLRDYFDVGLGEYEFGVHKFSSYGLPPDLAEIFHEIRSYSSIIEQYINGDIAQPDMRMICDQRNLVHFHVMSLPPWSALDPVELNPIYEACRIAAIIYSVGVVFPLPGVGAPLPCLSNLLREELQNSNLYESWHGSEGSDLFIWVLTMGAIAATDMPHREWFVGIMARYNKQAHLTDWVQLKRILKNVVWVDSACDDAGEKLWNDINQSRQESHRSETFEPPETVQPTSFSRRPQPCAHCGRRRVKCDKQNPCRNCVRHGLECTYERLTGAQWQQQRSIQLMTRKQPCLLCRRRKIKCEGENPCNHCEKGGFDCVYESPRGEWQ